MHVEVLTQDQVAVLEGLTGLEPVAGFYLAGGTALALRHGHRRSIDFDFFRMDAFDGQALRGVLDTAFVGNEWLPSCRRVLCVV